QQEEAAALAGEAQRVDFDAHLEEEKHDADVSQHGQLVSVGDVSGRERGHKDPNQQVTDDSWKTKRSRTSAGERRQEQQEAQVEDRGRCVVHCRDNINRWATWTGDLRGDPSAPRSTATPCAWSR